MTLLVRTIKRIAWVCMTLESGDELTGQEAEIIAFWVSGVIYGVFLGFVVAMVCR